MVLLNLHWAAERRWESRTVLTEGPDPVQKGKGSTAAAMSPFGSQKLGTKNSKTQRNMPLFPMVEKEVKQKLPENKS